MAWPDMTREQRIDAIKAVYEPDSSASDLADRTGAPSRNAIIGLYTRYPDQLAGFPLRGKTGWRYHTAEKTRERKMKELNAPPRKRRSRRAVVKISPARPKPQNYILDKVIRAVPLMELRQNECKWPVNDPPSRGLHLFCGCKTDGGSYCGVHTARSIKVERA